MYTYLYMYKYTLVCEFDIQTIKCITTGTLSFGGGDQPKRANNAFLCAI